MPPPSPTAVLPDTVLADTVARTRSRWIPPPPCRKPVAVAVLSEMVLDDSVNELPGPRAMPPPLDAMLLVTVVADSVKELLEPAEIPPPRNAVLPARTRSCHRQPRRPPPGAVTRHRSRRSSPPSPTRPVQNPPPPLRCSQRTPHLRPTEPVLVEPTPAREQPPPDTQNTHIAIAACWTHSRFGWERLRAGLRSARTCFDACMAPDADLTTFYDAEARAGLRSGSHPVRVGLSSDDRVRVTALR